MRSRRYVIALALQFTFLSEAKRLPGGTSCADISHMLTAGAMVVSVFSMIPHRVIFVSRSENAA